MTDSCDPMDCNLPGYSVRGIFPGKNVGVGSHFLLQRIFLTQGLNLCFLHCRFFTTEPPEDQTVNLEVDRIQPSCWEDKVSTSGNDEAH